MSSKPIGTVEFSAPDTHPAAFIVYINGIEVPVKSVNVRYGVWDMPRITLEMVADPVLQRIGAEDRLQVAIFDLDDTQPDPSVAPAFRLLSEGEVTSWGYRNSPGGRSIILVVDNQLAIFTQLFVQFVTNVDDMVAYHTYAGSGTVDQANVSSELLFPDSLFRRGLVVPMPTQSNGAPDTATFITRPFDFMYNVVRSMAGKVPDAQRAVPSTQFFTRWARLTNFINRFVACPVFDEQSVIDANPNANIFPILKALQSTSAVNTVVKNLLPNAQNSGSFYDMLRMVYQMVFMEIAMIPGMPLVDVDLETSVVKKTDFNKHYLTNSVADVTAQKKELQSKIQTLQTALAKQQEAYTAALSGNISLTGVILGQMSDTTYQIGQAQAELDALGDVAIPVFPVNPTTPKRIQNYFSKPQMLFGLPPACNVVFPSQIRAIQYEENYATQPTRLYFNDEVLPRTYKMGNDGLGQAITNLLTIAYPPEADAAVKARMTASAKITGKNFLLYPEEFYKGPVLDRRPIPTWLYFLRQAELTKTPASQENAPTGAPASKQAAYDKYARASPDVYGAYTEYEYYRERYSRRGGSATLTWNPYIVPGFPMAIFDQRASRVDLFAYAISVQHVMTHRSRETIVSFSHGRSVQEMFDVMINEFANNTGALGTGPREPIKEVRQAIQNFDRAELFYQKLFYGAQKLYGKDAVMDWRKLIAYAPVVPEAPPESIYVYGGSEAAISEYETAQATIVTQTKALTTLNTERLALIEQQTQAQNTLDRNAANQSSTTYSEIQVAQAQQDLETINQKLKQKDKEIVAAEKSLTAAEAVVNDETISKSTTVTHNLDPTREIVPTRAAEKYFENYDEAMAYNWRPRCTLDEYIIFHNSKGEGEIPAFGHPRSVGVRYYSRIQRMTPPTADTVLPKGADGLSPPYTENPAGSAQGTTNEATGTTPTQSKNTPKIPGLPRTFPQTRSDWDSILTAYRNNVYNVKVPRR